MNKGERAELKFIATLFCHVGHSINFSNSSKAIDVDSVGVPLKNTKLIKTLSGIPEKINPNIIRSMSDAQLKEFCTAHGIEKAGLFSKSDVYINGFGYSIKSYDGSPPAIVNHTNRLGWQFVAKNTGGSIDDLDNLVNDYWNKRLSGVITEDVVNRDISSPFTNHLKILKPFLEYFCFDGSGSKISDHPADYIIEFTDPCDLNTCCVYDRSTYLPHVWSSLCFSLRSKKGMPTNIDTLDPLDKESVMLWSRMFNGSLKGALHVRVK